VSLHLDAHTWQTGNVTFVVDTCQRPSLGVNVSVGDEVVDDCGFG
jgi:hypothetical protein